MDTLEKAELIASICLILIYNVEFPDTVGRKMRRRRRTQRIAKRYGFRENSKRKARKVFLPPMTKYFDLFTSAIGVVSIYQMVNGPELNCFQ